MPACRQTGNEQVTEAFVKKVYDFIDTLADFPETSHKGESHKQKNDYDGEFHVAIKKQIINT